MKLESIEAKCMDCGKKFLFPSLGDQSYGYDIFSGEKGSVFGRFQAVDNLVWNFVEPLLEKNEAGRTTIWNFIKAPLEKTESKRARQRKASIDRSNRLFGACAYLADPIKRQRLSNRIICPRCYSSNTELGRKVNEVLEVYDVSHREFLSLPELARRQKVLEFDRSYPS